MSHCVVPNWNLRHQGQEQVEGEEGSRSSHVHNLQNQSSNTSTTTTTTTTTSCNHAVPISNYQVKELTWENGQLPMHGLGGLLPSGPTKPTWGRTGGTLESVVHQATCHKQDPDVTYQGHGPFIGKWAGNSGQAPPPTSVMRKRSHSDSDYGGRNFSSSSNIQAEHGRPSACASASATFCRESDTTMMTWASYESPHNLKNKTNDEDSVSHGGLENHDEDQETKGGSGRPNSTRRSRAAATHNQSERRRRDRISQKMKALQKLVPNASKTDKASMLDEVIEYLKQLQAQVQMMNNVRNMAPQQPPPQMVMPLAMQQQLQMLLLARMGMAMGMGMLDMSSMARAAPQSLPSPLFHPNLFAANAGGGPTFVQLPFMVPHMVPAQGKPGPAAASSTCAPSVPLPDTCCAFLAQSMNMDLYSKMAALYSQQINQTTQATSSPSRLSLVQED